MISSILDNKIRGELTMANKDVVIECKDCGKQFTVTAEEQEWYKQKGFDLPKRYNECRKSRRNHSGR